MGDGDLNLGPRCLYSGRPHHGNVLNEQTGQIMQVYFDCKACETAGTDKEYRAQLKDGITDPNECLGREFSKEGSLVTATA